MYANRDHANRPTALTMSDRNRAAIIARREREHMPRFTLAHAIAIGAPIIAGIAVLASVAP